MPSSASPPTGVLLGEFLRAAAADHDRARACRRISLPAEGGVGVAIPYGLPPGTVVSVVKRARVEPGRVKPFDVGRPCPEIPREGINRSLISVVARPARRRCPPAKRSNPGAARDPPGGGEVGGIASPANARDPSHRRCCVQEILLRCVFCPINHAR